MKRLLSAGFFALAATLCSFLPAAADEVGPAPSPSAVPATMSAAPAGSDADDQIPALQVATAAPKIVVAAGANRSGRHGAKAPADEYFGQLKMSILGVRNVVTDIDTRADTAAEAAALAMCHKLVLAENALRDWQTKYPDDTWIPKLGYAMLKDYEKVDTAIVADDSHIAGMHAVDLAAWLDITYPNSEYAPR